MLDGCHARLSVVDRDVYSAFAVVASALLVQGVAHMTLTERITAQIASLDAEKARITTDAARDLAAVEVKLAALAAAKPAITGEVEAAYVALRRLGLITEIEG